MFRRHLNARIANARQGAARAVHNVRYAAAAGRRQMRMPNYSAVMRRLGLAAGGVAAAVGGPSLARFVGGRRFPQKRTHKLGHGQAFKKVKRVRAMNGRPKVGRKFKTKVEKVLDYGKPWGEYTYFSDQRLWQSVKDEYNFIENDNNGKKFDQFHPIQFWDAASVLFNEKALSNDWEANTSQGATNNIRYKQPLHVINSYTKFEFKSTSSHIVNVEMYICTPKGNVISEYPGSCVTDSKNDVNNAYYYLNPAFAPTAGTFDIARNEGSTSAMWSELYRQFTVVKVLFKFNPGEHKTHFLQGPKNFTIDGTKYANEAGTNLQTARFQRQIFFRVINDPTVNGVGGGAQTDCCARWASNIQGGVAMRQKRVIRVRLPDNTDFSTVAKAGDLKQNTIKIGHWCRTAVLDADQQVSIENPVVLANTSLPQ